MGLPGTHLTIKQTVPHIVELRRISEVNCGWIHTIQLCRDWVLVVLIILVLKRQKNGSRTRQCLAVKSELVSQGRHHAFKLVCGNTGHMQLACITLQKTYLQWKLSCHINYPSICSKAAECSKCLCRASPDLYEGI